MTWFKALYRCPVGHTQEVTLPDPPANLVLPAGHGRAPLRIRTCGAPLHLVSKVQLDAS